MISATTSILTEINFNRIVKLVNRTGRYQLHLPQSSHVPGQAIGNWVFSCCKIDLIERRVLAGNTLQSILRTSNENRDNV